MLFMLKLRRELLQSRLLPKDVRLNWQRRKLLQRPKLRRTNVVLQLLRKRNVLPRLLQRLLLKLPKRRLPLPRLLPLPRKKKKLLLPPERQRPLLQERLQQSRLHVRQGLPVRLQNARLRPRKSVVSER